jgi:acyl carrier protein
MEYKMLNKEQVIKDLKKFFLEELFVDLKEDDIGLDMRIGQELGVDSLGFTEIMAYLEDQFNISITQAEFIPDNFRTINSLLLFLEKKLNQN